MEIKKYIYNKSRPVIVSPSRWLEQITNDSPLFDNCLKYRVPYGVDHAEFLPMNKREARQKLRLKEDCKYLLWAASDVNDERKGFKYFERAMESFASLASTDNIEILIVGRSYSRSSTIENHFEVKILVTWKILKNFLILFPLQIYLSRPVFRTIYRTSFLKACLVAHLWLVLELAEY